MMPYYTCPVCTQRKIKDILRLLRLKCKCRIRGLSCDIQNCKEGEEKYFLGGRSEYEELLRHLEDIKFIIADIDCGEHYLTESEKEEFEELKEIFGGRDESNN